VAGLVANRVTPDLWPGGAPLPDAAGLAAVLPGDAALCARLAATLAEHQALARADAASLERLFAAVPLVHSVVPRLEQDVHDLAGLARLADRL